jgi:hypothetical protein
VAAVIEIRAKILPIFLSHNAFSRLSTPQEVSRELTHERKRRAMPQNDTLLSPHELMRLHPHFGLRLQRERRKAGDFIPHIRVGHRIYYRRSSVEKFLAESETQNGGDHDNA